MEIKIIIIGIQLFALISSIILHEIAHGYIAFIFGDNTAKNLGRLTLNPVPHIDPLGSILLPGILMVTGAPILIGWAKPVPVNPRYFKNPYRDMMWVAIAGPLTNITIAVICSIILKSIPADLINQSQLSAMLIFSFALKTFIQINLVLALFNLFPIPPLDGSRILMNFLPSHLQSKLHEFERYGFLVIFLLAYLGLFHTIFRVVLTPLFAILL